MGLTSRVLFSYGFFGTKTTAGSVLHAATGLTGLLAPRVPKCQPGFHLEWRLFVLQPTLAASASVQYNSTTT
jgi:hypothetical protein